MSELRNRVPLKGNHQNHPQRAPLHFPSPVVRVLGAPKRKHQL